MGSTLGSVTAGTFMVERYVDDTIAYVKTDAIDYVLSNVNSFHTKIKFNCEIEDCICTGMYSPLNHGNEKHLKHYFYDPT